MVIRFCTDYNFDNYKPVKANTYDEVRSLLKEEFENIGNKDFSYLWFDDGFAATYFTEDDCPEYEDDANKMLDKVIKRMEDFGTCIFHYDGGMIAIYADESNN